MTSRELKNPYNVQAINVLNDISQNTKPMTKERSHAIGKAFFAEKLKTVINKIVSNIGEKANKASIKFSLERINHKQKNSNY